MLQNATCVLYVVQDWPFALFAGALPRICFLARRLESEQRNAYPGDWSRTTQLCQPCFQGDLTLGDNAVSRFHSLKLNYRDL